MATFLTQVLGGKGDSKRFTRYRLQGSVLKSPTIAVDKVLEMARNSHHNLKLVHPPRSSHNTPAFLPRKLARKTVSGKPIELQKH